MTCLRDAFSAYPPLEERRPYMSRWRVSGYGNFAARTLAPMTPRTSNGRLPARGFPFRFLCGGTFDETRAPRKPTTHLAIRSKVKWNSFRTARIENDVPQGMRRKRSDCHAGGESWFQVLDFSTEIEQLESVPNGTGRFCVCGGGRFRRSGFYRNCKNCRFCWIAKGLL